MLCQLSYTHRSQTLAPARVQAACQRFARQKGFEPMTRGLEGRCSFLLSYWRKNRGEPI